MQKFSLDEATASTTPVTPTEPTWVTPASATQLDAAGGFSQNRPVFNTEKPMPKSSPVMFIVLLVLAIGAGVATGFGGYKLKAQTTGGPSLGGGNQPIQQVAGEASAIKNGQVFGVQDEKTFKDSAEGYLEDGGIGGEGSHKLLRAGGVSQTVVLTSSVTDLSKFVGMQVKVSGETFKAQKAGWLMDVGRVEVVNTTAQPPTGEE